MSTDQDKSSLTATGQAALAVWKSLTEDERKILLPLFLEELSLVTLIESFFVYAHSNLTKRFQERYGSVLNKKHIPRFVLDIEIFEPQRDPERFGVAETDDVATGRRSQTVSGTQKQPEFTTGNVESQLDSFHKAYSKIEEEEYESMKKLAEKRSGSPWRTTPERSRET